MDGRARSRALRLPPCLAGSAALPGNQVVPGGLFRTCPSSRRLRRDRRGRRTTCDGRLLRPVRRPDLHVRNLETAVRQPHDTASAAPGPASCSPATGGAHASRDDGPPGQEAGERSARASSLVDAVHGALGSGQDRGLSATRQVARCLRQPMRLPRRQTTDSADSRTATVVAPRAHDRAPIRPKRPCPARRKETEKEVSQPGERRPRRRSRSPAPSRTPCSS
jgi:hypothetical protein